MVLMAFGIAGGSVVIGFIPGNFWVILIFFSIFMMAWSFANSLMYG